MARSRASTDRTAERILRRIRREMLGEVEAGIEQLDAVYARVAEQLQQELRGVTSRATIERIARERLEDALSEVLPIIDAGVLAGAVAGASTTTETFRAIFPRVAPPRVAVELEAQRAAARVMRGDIVARDVPLSARVRRNHREIAQRMSREIQGSMRAGEGAFETMERILAVDSETRITEIPQYIQRLAEAAREGGAALRDEIAGARRYINGLGSVDRGNTSIRAATEELVKRLERANAEDIDGIVNRWALDKAQYQAKVIARTEAIAAHREAYERQMSSRPWTKGFKWSLSAGHKVPDICDLLANQNLYGLGPGGYPPDALPNTPHPSCTCSQTAIIDEQHMERELAREEGTAPPPETWNVGGEQDAAEWLAQQPEAFQRQILGPTRLDAFRQQPERVLGPQGEIRSVRSLTTRPRRTTRAAQ